MRQVISRLVTLWTIALVGCAITSSSHAAQPSAPVAGIVAPNVAVVSSTLVTAGQPNRESLLGLKQAGYSAVINLAPGNAPDAVSDEAQILQSQGIEFVHIPIPWQSPEAKHLEAMAAAMAHLQGKKVLIHCQMNMRASAITFLYRAIYAKEAPAAAWIDVKRIWTPNEQWAKFIDEQLRANGIAFKAE